MAVSSGALLSWLAVTYVTAGSLIPTPQIPSAHTASAARTATSCTVLVDDSGLLVPPAYISADMLFAQQKAIAAVRLAAAPIECNTKHGVAYTKRKCQRCGTGVDNEHHLLFECSHVALVASRSKHRALFDVVRDVREWMAASYKPELAATLESCMQDMMHCLKAEGQPNVTPASSLGRCNNK
jgi:hypothetical protein